MGKTTVIRRSLCEPKNKRKGIGDTISTKKRIAFLIFLFSTAIILTSYTLAFSEQGGTGEGSALNGSKTTSIQGESTLESAANTQTTQATSICEDTTEEILTEAVIQQTTTTEMTEEITDEPTEVSTAEQGERYAQEEHDAAYVGTNFAYSEYEIDLIARTIYQEVGICGEYCQWLVGSTILNLADINGGIESVVFDYNTFNVAYQLFDATPSELSYSVARRVASGDRDYNVKAFRSDYYHNFGTPYICVDNTYFSTY